jgi:hypothetical protein
MNIRLLSFAGALALSISSGAMAQNTAYSADSQAEAPFAAATAVGRWLHDPQGNVIGSVRALADGGRIAVIMAGSYFEPGSHAARVPARALFLVDGKITLQAETVETLNVRLR